MIKEDIKAEIVTGDDKPYLYASISAEHKAKKRWVAKLDLSRLVSVIMPGCR